MVVWGKGDYINIPIGDMKKWATGLILSSV